MLHFPLSLRERAGVREAARIVLAVRALTWARAALAASLTPTLSRREREKQQPLNS